MTNYSWECTFLDLFERTLKRYHAGNFRWDCDFRPDDLSFLGAIGYQPREFFDYVEDYADRSEPSPAAAAMIASVRRDYFRTIQKGVPSSHRVSPSDLPPKEAGVQGIRWLPRIIAKAEAKLRGELDPDMMYSCGGDRAFLREHDIHPADFLRLVWAARGDLQKIVDYVKTPSPRVS